MAQERRRASDALEGRHKGFPPRRDRTLAARGAWRPCLVPSRRVPHWQATSRAPASEWKVTPCESAPWHPDPVKLLSSHLPMRRQRSRVSYWAGGRPERPGARRRPELGFTAVGGQGIGPASRRGTGTRGVLPAAPASGGRGRGRIARVISAANPVVGSPARGSPAREQGSRGARDRGEGRGASETTRTKGDKERRGERSWRARVIRALRGPEAGCRRGGEGGSDAAGAAKRWRHAAAALVGAVRAEDGTPKRRFEASAAVWNAPSTSHLAPPLDKGPRSPSRTRSSAHHCPEATFETEARPPVRPSSPRLPFQGARQRLDAEATERASAIEPRDCRCRPGRPGPCSPTPPPC